MSLSPMRQLFDTGIHLAVGQFSRKKRVDLPLETVLIQDIIQSGRLKPNVTADQYQEIWVKFCAGALALDILAAYNDYLISQKIPLRIVSIDDTFMGVMLAPEEERM